MAAYTGSLLFTPQLGNVGVPTVVTAKFSFTAATLVGADTFNVDVFAQNGVEVPVQVLQHWLSFSAPSPTGLAMRVGNTDVADGFLLAATLIAGSVPNRLGNGSLIGQPIRRRGVTMGVTTDATAAYTGDILLSFLCVLNRN